MYLNIPHEKGLPSVLRKRLDKRTKKYISTDPLRDLAEVLLKDNLFKFSKKTFKQKRGTAFETKFAPPYSILYKIGRSTY